MLFNSVFVDVFNLAYRKSSSNDCTKIANDFIDFMNTEVKKYLDPNGIVYMLYDPIPKSDLGLSKAFKYSPRIRNEINSSYKKNRESNPNVIAAIKLLRKYYTFRGEKIQTCISNNLEADDFVEQLLTKVNGNVALISTDLDWARYISDRVVLINQGFDNPFTKEEYLKKYGIIPTVATVTLKKAIFGDPSDNIEGIFTNKKFVSKTAEDSANSMLMYIANENLPFKEVEEHIKNAEFKKLFQIKSKNPLEEFEYELVIADQSVSSPYNQLIDNIRIIKSRCDNINKYISYKNVDEKYNNLMDTVLKRQNGIKKEIKFGILKA